MKNVPVKARAKTKADVDPYLQIRAVLKVEGNEARKNLVADREVEAEIGQGTDTQGLDVREAVVVQLINPPSRDHIDLAPEIDIGSDIVDLEVDPEIGTDQEDRDLNLT